MNMRLPTYQPRVGQIQPASRPGPTQLSPEGVRAFGRAQREQAQALQSVGNVLSDIYNDRRKAAVAEDTVAAQREFRDMLVEFNQWKETSLTERRGTAAVGITDDADAMWGKLAETHASRLTDAQRKKFEENAFMARPTALSRFAAHQADEAIKVNYQTADSLAELHQRSLAEGYISGDASQADLARSFIRQQREAQRMLMGLDETWVDKTMQQAETQAVGEAIQTSINNTDWATAKSLLEGNQEKLDPSDASKFRATIIAQELEAQAHALTNDLWAGMVEPLPEEQAREVLDSVGNRPLSELTVAEQDEIRAQRKEELGIPPDAEATDEELGLTGEETRPLTPREQTKADEAMAYAQLERALAEADKLDYRIAQRVRSALIHRHATQQDIRKEALQAEGGRLLSNLMETDDWAAGRQVAMSHPDAESRWRLLQMNDQLHQLTRPVRGAAGAASQRPTTPNRENTVATWQVEKDILSGLYTGHDGEARLLKTAASRDLTHGQLATMLALRQDVERGGKPRVTPRQLEEELLHIYAATDMTDFSNKNPDAAQHVGEIYRYLQAEGTRRGHTTAGEDLALLRELNVPGQMTSMDEQGRPVVQPKSLLVLLATRAPAPGDRVSPAVFEGWAVDPDRVSPRVREQVARAISEQREVLAAEGVDITSRNVRAQLKTTAVLDQTFLYDFYRLDEDTRSQAAQMARLVFDVDEPALWQVVLTSRAQTGLLNDELNRANQRDPNAIPTVGTIRREWPGAAENFAPTPERVATPRTPMEQFAHELPSAVERAAAPRLEAFDRVHPDMHTFRATRVGATIHREAAQLGSTIYSWAREDLIRRLGRQLRPGEMNALWDKSLKQARDHIGIDDYFWEYQRPRLPGDLPSERQVIQPWIDEGLVE